MSGSTNDYWWQQYGGATVPGDAIVVIAFVALTNGILYAYDGPVLRALVGLPLLFFVPGYALVSLLFPGASVTDSAPRRFHRGRSDSHRSAGTDPEWAVRLALAFGTSLVVLPVLALGVAAANAGFSSGVIVTALSAFAVVTMSLAVVRRYRRPADERFRVPYRRWVQTAERGLFGSESRLEPLLTVALAVVVIASVATLGYAAVAPNNAETFTDVSLLAEQDGELVSSSYPSTLEEGGSELVLQVANREGSETTYTVVGQLQRVDTSGESVRVLERAEVVRASETVAEGEEWTHSHAVEPALAGEDLRLIYFVYRGEAPESPSESSAYRSVHIWVDSPAGEG